MSQKGTSLNSKLDKEPSGDLFEKKNACNDTKLPETMVAGGTDGRTDPLKEMRGLIQKSKTKLTVTLI